MSEEDQRFYNAVNAWLESVQALLDGVRPDGIRFERQWFFVAASILAWWRFWNLADAHQHDRRSQIMAWTAVGLAIWAATYL